MKSNKKLIESMIQKEVRAQLNESDDSVSINILKSLSKFLRQLNIFISSDKEKAIAKAAASHPDVKKLDTEIKKLEDELTKSFESRYKTDPRFKKIIDAMNSK